VAEVLLLDGFAVDGSHGVAGDAATSGKGGPGAGYGDETKCDASSLDHCV
jgi:hypothetical protein